MSTLTKTVTQENAENVETANNADNCDVDGIKTECDKSCHTESAETVIAETVADRIERLHLCEIGEKSQINSTPIVQVTESLKSIFSYDSSSDESDKETIAISEAESKASSETDETSDSSSTTSTSEDEEEAEVRYMPKEQRDLLSTEDATPYVYTDQQSCDILEDIMDVSEVEPNIETSPFLHMGDVGKIFHNLVNVEGALGIPAYNSGTILFVEQNGVKKPLGAIYDIFGPIRQPIYVIRLKDATLVKTMNLKEGTEVFSLPNSEHTKYIFMKDLEKCKGTDASWVGDVELPPELQTNSSDEESVEPSTQNNQTKRKRGKEPYKPYGNRTIRWNTGLAEPAEQTRSGNISGNESPFPAWHTPLPFQRDYVADRYTTPVNASSFTSTVIPNFNPSVPPPSLVYHPFYVHNMHPDVLNRR